MHPKLQRKIDNLRAMSFILEAVMTKLGSLSSYMSVAPEFKDILDWQKEFHAKLAELRTLIQAESRVPDAQDEEDIEDDEDEDDMHEEMSRSGDPSDFLVVEDKNKPSTWHLQVKEGGKPSIRLMGAAWAALHSGFRGNKYEGPNKQEAITKLTKLYHRMGLETPLEKKK